MSYGFSVEISGAFALFSRPELNVERVSYDCISPSAARGILEAVMWKPAIKYVIDRIHVIHPIRFTNVRRNEVTAVASASNARVVMQGGSKPLYIVTKQNIAQRASLLLRDVHYVVEAHFEMTEKASETDTPEKFYNMILRRLKKGQCFHTPYLGCREFPAKVSLLEGDAPPSAYQGTTQNLGLMLYDLDYKPSGEIIPMFFRASMEDGILDLVDCEVYQ